jgi:hypothetical protein
MTNERRDELNQNARSSFQPERAIAERTFTCGARDGTQAFPRYGKYITFRLIHQKDEGTMSQLPNEPMSQRTDDE